MTLIKIDLFVSRVPEQSYANLRCQVTQPERDLANEDFYILQYHLYVLALSQYLRMRHPDFIYASDFGGVFYLFVRGIDSHLGPEYGVYFDLPKPSIINALGKALIPNFSEL